MSFDALNASHNTYRGFKFYNGNDVKTGKGGYARVTLPSGRMAWGNAGKNPHSLCGVTVSFLGWGESPVLELTDFSEADQAKLRETF